jgi:dTDP-glucose 4,6-dehydratase
MKLLVTGGAGFIGSNFVRYVLNKYPAYSVLNLDKLTYSGSLDNLADLQSNSRHAFSRIDVCDRRRVLELLSQGVDAVVHFAAESHVDRSILESSRFVKTNVLGTQCLLEAARQTNVERFVQVSTDEVYGSAEQGGKFTEETALAPSSPYAASKAGADLIARAYFHTYKSPVIVTRCSNNYGPFQFPEKFIPLIVSRALSGQSIPVYGDGLQVRDWIHVADHCAALDAVLHHGREGEIYNIGAGNERPNLEIARSILQLLGKPESLLTFVQDRPGHDRRYAVDARKIREEVGWAPQTSFEAGLAATVQWYSTHRDWQKRVLTRAYRSYYRRQYDRRALTLAKVLGPTGGPPAGTEL